MMFLVVALIASAFCSASAQVAMVNLNHGSHGVSGLLSFVQQGDLVYISGTIIGLPDGEHGIHIHNSSDLTNDCQNVGDHYNPYGEKHGCQGCPIRHVGDLGNVCADDEGVSRVSKIDTVIRLTQVNWMDSGVIGLALAVDENRDDGGKGDGTSDEDGNSGAHLACGIINLI